MIGTIVNTCTIIADSGSTKTSWLLTDEEGQRSTFETPGINPVRDSEDFICDILTSLPQAPVSHLYFYGAGCIPPFSDALKALLQRRFPQARIVVDSDLMGAAIALCGNQEGIACILGTGSNSCLYDGERIVANVSPLGYILGDEGSGAVLGRRLVGDVLKRQLPETLRQAFEKEYQLTAADIIQRVYRSPLPNRFLASFAPFLSRHRYEPAVQALLEEEFARFFRRNVCAYRRPDLPVHFAGSIARHFQTEVFAAARSLGLQPGRVEAAPMEALVRYHLDRTDAYLI